MKTVIEFGKINYSDPKVKNNLVTLEIELKLISDRTDKLNYLDLSKVSEYYTLSICGNIWNSKKTDIVCGGQCLDAIKPYLRRNPLFNELFDLWNEYHLNDMKAGTFKQSEALKEFKGDYTAQCELLKSKGILIDNGYQYGTKWLLKVIPSEVVERIKTIIENN